MAFSGKPPVSKQDEPKSFANKQLREPREISASQPKQEIDIFDQCKKSLDRCFEEAMNTALQYQQSLAGVQRECVESYRKYFETVISIQEEFARRFGFGIAEEYGKVLSHNPFESMIKAYMTSNQAMLAAINRTKENIMDWNYNSKMFAELNKSIFQPWSYWWKTGRD
jgi:hypothetical protein